MPKLPIFRLRSFEPRSRPDLQYYGPTLAFSDLQLGVDNLRYDVFLSPRITADLSFHLARYICRFGEVESLFEMDVPAAPNQIPARRRGTTKLRKPGPADLKTLLVSIHLAILNRAKAEGNPSVDVLGRMAVLKFIRTELQAQFARILEQCKMKSKSLEGVRQAKMMQTQELVSSFQVRKKIILRRAGQEMFRLLREIEKETLAPTRRSLLRRIASRLLSPVPQSSGSYRRWTRRLSLRRALLHVRQFRQRSGPFLQSPPVRVKFSARTRIRGSVDDAHLEQALNVPKTPPPWWAPATAKTRHWKIAIEKTALTSGPDCCSAKASFRCRRSYEAVPLLAEYAPRVNPQQIKNALIFREEAARVEKIIAESRLHSDRLFAAVGRVASCRSSERSRFAARLLHDLFCYHRDLRGLEALTARFDSVNLVSDHKVRELSTLNGMLMSSCLPKTRSRPRIVWFTT